MTHPDRTARILTALVVGIVTLVVVLVVASNASAYVHLAQCQASLRGYNSDDDIHWFGLQTGASSFAGWSSSYTRINSNDLYVYGYVNYPSSSKYYPWRRVQGHCWLFDYGPDTFGGMDAPG